KMVEAAKIGAIGALGASIAHDIRNIMTPLRMEILHLANGNSAGDALAHLDRLSALSHRLLAMGQPDNLNLGPVTIDEVLSRVIPLITAQAEVNSVKIVTHIPHKLPAILADFGRMEHLFVNLALNGLNAMASSGGTLSFSAREDKRGVAIEVADTGPGISPEHLPHVFEPFYTTRANGLGLGLFSAKSIVEYHGGNISVSSEISKGALFTVWLPSPRCCSDTKESERCPASSCS